MTRVERLDLVGSFLIDDRFLRNLDGPDELSSSVFMVVDPSECAEPIDSALTPGLGDRLRLFGGLVRSILAILDRSKQRSS